MSRADKDQGASQMRESAAMKPPYDGDHQPYDLCYRVDWQNCGVASRARINDMIKWRGKHNVRVDARGVLWVWGPSPVTRVRPIERRNASKRKTVVEERQ